MPPPPREFVGAARALRAAIREEDGPATRASYDLPMKSGQPPGFQFRATEYHRVRQICAENSEEAAKIQVELMRNEDPRIQLLATEAVLNRGVGKPRDHSDEERKARRIDLSGLSGDELKSLGTLLKKALGL